MNTIEHAATTVGRVPLAFDELPSPNPRFSVELRPAEVRANHRTARAPSRCTAAWLRTCAHDETSSELANFPFALIAFATLGGGLLVACCGIVILSAWLSILGFLLTLAGGGMYGWSLYDE